MGEELISTGGVDVEGESSFSLRNKRNISPKVEEFNKNFEAYFGKKPVSDADLVYEVAEVFLLLL